MAWGLDFNGRLAIKQMVDNLESSSEIKKTISRLVRPNDFDYEANEALARYLEERGYQSVAQYLRDLLHR